MFAVPWTGLWVTVIAGRMRGRAVSAQQGTMTILERLPNNIYTRMVGVIPGNTDKRQ